MPLEEVLRAVLAGAVQGIFEWLPISSQGAVSILFTGLGLAPAGAVRLALFLHLGTALAATGYYRRELVDLIRGVPRWDRTDPFGGDSATLTFLGVATIVSGIVGLLSYFVFLAAVTALAGGAFIALIGVLLVGTGLIQRVGAAHWLTAPVVPGPFDAVIVGIGQGLAILPGISRSGTTVSILLLRGHDEERSFDLSFLLAIPASLGAAILVLLDGVLVLDPMAGTLAVAVSAIVGYLTIDALLRIVRRIAFWAVCLGFGLFAIAGGLVVLLV